jgi:hypothetical protein
VGKFKHFGKEKLFYSIKKRLSEMALGKMNSEGNTKIIPGKKRVPNSTSSLRLHVAGYLPGNCRQLKDSELSKMTWFHESVIIFWYNSYCNIIYSSAYKTNVEAVRYFFLTVILETNF